MSLALREPTNLTIVSNCQMGIVPALAKIIPSARHCYYCHHLVENIKSGFSDSAIVIKFWCATKAYRACEHEAYIYIYIYKTLIRAVNEDAYNYVQLYSVTGSPSIGSPKMYATSSKVIVASPIGR